MKFVSATLIAIVMPASGYSCAVIGSYGAKAKTSGETALIVWHEDSNTEDFIRSANFETNAMRIGFLVPTPTQPKLSEVNTSLFRTIFKVARDHALSRKTKGRSPDLTDRVRVLSSTNVDGYTAVVFKAGDIGAVKKWLKAHHFPADKSTLDYLTPYLKKNWTITAFKIARGKTTADLKPVRMTFKSPAPFYPYKEPNISNSRSRTFDLFFLSDHQHMLSSGNPALFRQVWTLSSDEQARISQTLGFAAPNHLAYLTWNGPRKSEGDLWFRQSQPSR